MNHGVIYYLVGGSTEHRGQRRVPLHAMELIVSLTTLRQFYAGPVAIIGNSIAAKEIANDLRLNVDFVPFDPPAIGRNTNMVGKTLLHRHTPFDVNVFIDADTMVNGPVQELFALAAEPSKPMVVTQFAKWTVKPGGVVARRVKSFAEAAGAMDLFEKVIDKPAINTGVMAWQKDCQSLEKIHALAMRGRAKFIPDECAAQLVVFGEERHVLSDVWNQSPLYGKIPNQEVRIFHNHGSKHLQDRVRMAWLKLLEYVWTDDLGRIRTWLDDELRERYIHGFLGIK